jgi:hypothetical protein
VAFSRHVLFRHVWRAGDGRYPRFSAGCGYSRADSTEAVVRRTAQFTAICLLIAYALSLAAYFTGEFSPIYLYLDLVFVAMGAVCAWLFATRPNSRLAYVLTLVCVMGMGSLICLAVILGSM